MGMKFIKKISVMVVPVLFFMVTPEAFAALQTERISVSSSGVQGNLTSKHMPSLSVDGRYVAFNSMASNLVPNDTNNSWDAFVYDRNTHTIERVSVSNSGVEGNGHSFATNISANGRYVVITSYASNLVPNDTNHCTPGCQDTFVYDRQLGTIERVSVNNQGVEGNLSSGSGTISDNGQFVAFWSMASNLVPNDTNNTADIFVYNRQTDTIERVSVNNDGAQGTIGHSEFPQISADGRYVAFSSMAQGLVPNDTNNSYDAFVYDRQTSTIKRISKNAQGVEGNNYSIASAMSANGRYVVLTSLASNFYEGDVEGTDDIFVYDNVTQLLQKVISGTSAWAGTPSISDNGRFVAFSSDRSDLVPNDTNNAVDIFMYDRQLQSIQRISVGNSGGQSNGESGHYLTISGDASHVAFVSAASNLVANDTNNTEDVFVRQLKRIIAKKPLNIKSDDSTPNPRPIEQKPENKQTDVVRPTIATESKSEIQTATLINSLESKESKNIEILKEEKSEVINTKR
jgi:6-phosphogluconate dehydrogenase (decarboxylating)